MFRFTLRPFVVLLSALLFVGLASAQVAANLPARAVVSYANLMTPELVAELQPLHPEVDDLAFALVDRYVADGVLDPALADAMRLSLVNGELPQAAFMMYLADVYNGEEAAPADLAAAQAQLAEAGVAVPVADENGMVDEASLTDALTNPVDAVLASDNSYNDAITPVAPATNR